MMLVRCVIEDQFSKDFQTPAMRFIQEVAEVLNGAVFRIYAVVVHDVIPVIPSGRRVGGHEPQAVDSEINKIIKARYQAAEVSPAVPVAVLESADVQFVYDRVLVPREIFIYLARHQCAFPNSPSNCRTIPGLVI